MTSPSRLSIAALAATSLLAACATTQMDAQWANPDYSGRSLRGSSLLVACEAPDLTLQRICEDQVSAQLSTLGATPVRNSQLRESATAATGPDPYVAAARRVGARAIVRTTLGVGAAVAQPGPQIGIGIGGSSGGWGSSTGGFGGISFPVGGARVTNSYSGETALIDPSNGAIMWSGRASSPTAQDVNGQIAELARVTADAIKQAGLL